MPAKKKAANKKAAKRQPAKKTIAKNKVATKKKTPPKTSDLDALQGTWHITSLEVSGSSAPGVAFDGTTISVRGNKFTSRGVDDGYTGILEIDQTKTPRAFDIVFDSGPQTGVRNLGIYELDGDEWKLCIDMFGIERPKRFATSPESSVALETLRRGPALRSRSAKPARKASDTSLGMLTQRVGVSDKPEARVGEPTEIEGEWAMLSAVFGGKPLAADMVAWCKRITRGSVTKILAGPQVMLDASFTVDGSHTPRQIDYVNRAGAAKGKAQAGIYDLTGDTLRICVAAPGDPRPADFASLNGDGRSFTTWKRSTA